MLEQLRWTWPFSFPSITLLIAYSLVAVNNYCIKISFNADIKINPLLFEVRIPVWTEKDRLRKDKEYSINLFLFLNQINQQDHYRNPGINIALLLLFWFWLLANRRIQHTGALSLSIYLSGFSSKPLSLFLWQPIHPKNVVPRQTFFHQWRFFVILSRQSKQKMKHLGLF